MIDICKKEICTGCSLCANVCAKKSISMQTIDDLGHLYPVVNQNTCVDCGLCRKVCPSINILPKQKPLECYAAWAKDAEDYKSSTSGGAASVLSQYIINKGGVVYGCAMFPNVEVKHIRVDNIIDLKKHKESKYVQSNIFDVLPTIKTDVKEGKKVLFIGTPCQCAGVKNLFKEQPDNLYLVDLVCHGIPSQNFLKQHVLRKVNGNIDKVLFRDGNAYTLSIISDSVIKYKKDLGKNRYEDVYLNAFFDGYSFRESCYSCQYAKPERAFDITIGDFWGLGKKNPTTEIPQHPNGCSVILPSSPKGVELAHAIQESMNMYPREVDEAVDGNDQLQHPYHLNRRIKLYRSLVRLGFGSWVYKLCVADKILKLKLLIPVWKKIKKNG